MKKILRIILALFLVPSYSFSASQNNIKVDKLVLGSSTATDKTIEFNTGSGAANPKIKINAVGGKLQFANDGSNYKDLGSGSGSGAGINLIDNSGFEQGVIGWTNSGGIFDQVTTGTNLLHGTKSVTFDASATAQYVESDAVVIPEILKGQNCLARIYYKGGDSNLLLEATDSLNVQLGSSILSSQNKVIPTTINFPCPTSGSLKLRVRSTGDAALLAIDNVTLGQADNLSQVGQAEMFGGLIYPAAASCVWSTASTTFIDLASNINCTTPVGSNLFGKGLAPDTKIPGIKFASLPPGKYRLVAIGNIAKIASAGATAFFRFSDGTNSSASNAIGGSSASSDDGAMVEGYFEYTTAQSNVTFRLQARATSSSAGAYATAEPFHFYVYKFPSNSELAYRPDQVAWRVDANIGGAIASLGAASVASYTGIENASIDLVNNAGAGVISAQIPCSATNSPTGSTCSVGNESVGVSFNAPTAGDVLACASFTSYASIAATSSLSQIFQLVETPNNAQTILQEGKSRTNNYVGLAQTLTTGNRVCGTFSFSSAGQKTIRLMYEQLVSGTVVSTLPADRAAAEGQRDIHFEVYPLNNYVPAPLLVNSVITGNAGILRLETGKFGTTSTCSIDESSSSWVSAPVNPSTGRCTYTISGFSSTPTCTTVETNGNANTIICKIRKGSMSSAGIGIDCESAAGAATNSSFDIICVGQR